MDKTIKYTIYKEKLFSLCRCVDNISIMAKTRSPSATVNLHAPIYQSNIESKMRCDDFLILMQPTNES